VPDQVPGRRPQTAMAFLIAGERDMPHPTATPRASPRSGA
jgi:hypothetical protein